MALDFLVIANPASGRGRAPTLAEDVVRLLKEKASVDLVLTSSAGDAAAQATRAVGDGVAVVVGCGGDGTLQEIAGVLAQSKTAMGILPGGRCNDLAHAVGLHKKDPPKDLAAGLLKNQNRSIDVGLFKPLDKPDVKEDSNGASITPKYFCTVATLGLDSQISRFVEHRRLPVRGTAAYVYGLFRVLIHFKPIRVELRGDFGEYKGEVVLMATGNTPFYGGAMRIAPGARVNDGLFDICILEAVPRTTILRILPKVFSGTHIKHPAVKMLQSRTVEIRTPGGPEWICADGESLGQTPAHLQVCEGALKLCSGTLPGS